MSVAPASVADAESVKDRSWVRPSLVLLPLSVNPVMVTGAATAGVVSIVMGTRVARLVLPKGSVAVMPTRCSPWRSAWVGVTLQVPSDLTTAVMTSPVGNVTVMVSPAVAPLPLKLGRVLEVMLSVSLRPVSLAAATSATGASGARVSTRKGLLSVPVTPKTLLTDAVTVWLPSASAATAMPGTCTLKVLTPPVPARIRPV